MSKTIKQIIKELNDLKIVQRSFDVIDDIPEEYIDYFIDDCPIKDELEIDRRRHYETSISVFILFDGFIGVKQISGIYSEQSSLTDINHILEFFECEEVMEINYKRIY